MENARICKPLGRSRLCRRQRRGDTGWIGGELQLRKKGLDYVSTANARCPLEKAHRENAGVL